MKFMLECLREDVSKSSDFIDELFVSSPDRSPLDQNKMTEEEAYNHWGTGFYNKLYSEREEWAETGYGLNTELLKGRSGLTTLDFLKGMKESFQKMYKKKSKK